MNHLLEVCLVALALSTGTTSFAAAQQDQAPPLRRGISVKLPVSSNAVAMPDADQPDSLIVSITADGHVYFGINRITPAALAEKLKGGRPNQAKEELYIKGDARTPYVNVAKILDAVHTAGLQTSSLLTAQPEESKSGTVVPPKGLEVRVGAPLPSEPQSIIVQVLNSGQRGATLKVNNEEIPRTDLPGSLRQLFRNQGQEVVRVEAAGRLPFADVVAVTDLCRSTGAQVVLVTPAL